jgi:pentatricopeptide repeat protein
MDEAMRLFSEMGKSCTLDVVAYSAMIHGACRCGDLKMVKRLLRDMVGETSGIRKLVRMINRFFFCLNTRSGHIPCAEATYVTTACARPGREAAGCNACPSQLLRFVRSTAPATLQSGSRLPYRPPATPPHPTHPPVPSAHGSHGSRRPPGRLGAGARGVPTPVPGGRHPAAAAGRASSRDEPLRGLRPVAQPALQE